VEDSLGYLADIAVVAAAARMVLARGRPAFHRRACRPHEGRTSGAASNGAFDLAV
jgi:hypothetical protein